MKYYKSHCYGTSMKGNFNILNYKGTQHLDECLNERKPAKSPHKTVRTLFMIKKAKPLIKQ